MRECSPNIFVLLILRAKWAFTRTQSVAHGNSVVVVEPSLDLVKAADWVIDLGPEGGVAGGQLIAEGTPEDVAQIKESYTGQCLKEML
jgi:excinuclease ABC subunit A